MRILRPPSWGGLLRRGVGGEEKERLFCCFADTPVVLILVHSAHWFVSGIDVHNAFLPWYSLVTSVATFLFSPFLEISAVFLLD
jgi:hypothetical protein